jgi:hypothetical protein
MSRHLNVCPCVRVICTALNKHFPFDGVGGDAHLGFVAVFRVAHANGIEGPLDKGKFWEALDDRHTLPILTQPSAFIAAKDEIVAKGGLGDWKRPIGSTIPGM